MAISVAAGVVSAAMREVGARMGFGIAGLGLVALVGCAAEDAAPPEQAARGEQLYAANCVQCHGGATGGDIADIPPRHNAEGHTWHHADCELIDIVLDGMPRRPELGEDVPAMPSFADRLEKDDVEAILAYIKTWWEPDQVEHQRQVTDQACD